MENRHEIWELGLLGASVGQVKCKKTLRELAKYMFNSIAVQKGGWEKGGTEKADNYNSLIKTNST
jgi:hypothetical protein